MARLTATDVEGLRARRWRSALLYITDRCPVECDHCSVGALRDGPRVVDRALFGEVLDALCAVPGFDCVGVTGGEPFAERWALTEAARRITEAGKHFVPYTSGFWGERRPAWVVPVIRRASCVYLGADGYHARRIPRPSLIGAIRCLAEEGVWAVLQVLPGWREEARRLLGDALGDDWPDQAEIRSVPALPYGRGAGLFDRPGRLVAGADLGRCQLVGSPVVRYDGRVTACCNEQVIGGGGPEALHGRARSAAGLLGVLARMADEPYFAALGAVGLGPITGLPPYRDLARDRFRSICQACWRALDRDGERARTLLAALATPDAGGGR